MRDLTAVPARLAIVASHPIQYQTPLWRRLSERGVVRPTVLYLSRHGLSPSYDPGFGRPVQIDDDLLAGFESQFILNMAPRRNVSSPTGLFNPGLATALRRTRYDAVLVHGHGHISAWLTYATVTARRLPYLIRGESHVPSGAETSGRALLRRALLRSVVGHAAACLAIGERNAHFYTHYGAESSRIIPSPYAVDNVRFAASGVTARATRASTLAALDLDPSLPTIAFAGKLIERKRPLDLVRAHQRMSCPSNLILIGDGELRPVVQNAMNGSRNAQRVGFLDQKALAPMLGISDVFVLPSESETWGLVVNEAMAAGSVPVVSDAVGCAPDLAPEGIGCVFRMGDVDALSCTLDRLVGDADELERRRMRAQAWVQRWSLDAAAEGIEAGMAIAVVSR